MLIRQFRRAMDELGVFGKLVAADINVAAPAWQEADEGVIVPRAGTVEHMPALLDIVKQHEIGLVIPLADTDIRSLARHQDQFAELDCQVMVGPSDTVVTCHDKTKTSKLLTGLGLSSIRTLSLKQFRKEPFYPCFIKPVRGSASIGAATLKNAAQFAGHLARHGERMVIQDYVPGSEFTLDIFRTHDGEVPCVVPRQRLEIRAGEVSKGVTVKDDKLIAAGVKLGEALKGLWGVVNAQCRRAEDGSDHFFEINPRFGGGAPLAIAAGADLPRYVLEETLGLPVSAKLGEFEGNLLMLRYDDAVYVPVDDPSALPGADTPQVR